METLCPMDMRVVYPLVISEFSSQFLVMRTFGIYTSCWPNSRIGGDLRRYHAYVTLI